MSARTFNATLQWLIDENREARGINGSEGFHARPVAVMDRLAVRDMNDQSLVQTAMGNVVKVGCWMGYADEQSAVNLLRDDRRENAVDCYSATAALRPPFAAVHFDLLLHSGRIKHRHARAEFCLE